MGCEGEGLFTLTGASRMILGLELEGRTWGCCMLGFLKVGFIGFVGVACRDVWGGEGGGRLVFGMGDKRLCM